MYSMFVPNSHRWTAKVRLSRSLWNLYLYYLFQKKKIFQSVTKANKVSSSSIVAGFECLHSGHDCISYACHVNFALTYCIPENLLHSATMFLICKFCLLKNIVSFNLFTIVTMLDFMFVLRSFVMLSLCKVCDFGLSVHLTANESHVSNTRCGTPVYMAPEVRLFITQYSYTCVYTIYNTFFTQMCIHVGLLMACLSVEHVLFVK